jgi:hypothetical protein
VAEVAGPSPKLARAAATVQPEQGRILRRETGLRFPRRNVLRRSIGQCPGIRPRPGFRTRRARPEPQEQQLQDALNRDVNNGQNHGTSGNTTRSPLFYADRINAPYRISGTHASMRPRRPDRLWIHKSPRDASQFLISRAFFLQRLWSSCAARSNPSISA